MNVNQIGHLIDNTLLKYVIQFRVWFNIVALSSLSLFGIKFNKRHKPMHIFTSVNVDELFVHITMNGAKGRILNAE